MLLWDRATHVFFLRELAKHKVPASPKGGLLGDIATWMVGASASTCDPRVYGLSVSTHAHADASTSVSSHETMYAQAPLIRVVLGVWYTQGSTHWGWSSRAKGQWATVR